MIYFCLKKSSGLFPSLLNPKRRKNETRHPNQRGDLGQCRSNQGATVEAKISSVHKKGGKMDREKERQKRFEIANRFISRFQPPPVSWYVSGSTAQGDFRPDSDIDITALWEKSEEIPLAPKENNFMFFFEGYKIDLQSFAQDWLIFKYRPDVLETIFPDLKKEKEVKK
jgi:predicted nucleotidyltransferase